MLDPRAEHYLRQIGRLAAIWVWRHSEWSDEGERIVRASIDATLRECADWPETYNAAVSVLDENGVPHV